MQFSDIILADIGWYAICATLTHMILSLNCHIAYWPRYIIWTFSIPADIYVGPLQVVQPTGMKYYPTPNVPADVYVGPL